MNTSAAIMLVRMKPLPRRHRIAHLRALLRQQPARAIRGAELATLLRAETTARSTNKDHAI